MFVSSDIREKGLSKEVQQREQPPHNGLRTLLGPRVPTLLQTPVQPLQPRPPQRRLPPQRPSQTSRKRHRTQNETIRPGRKAKNKSFDAHNPFPSAADFDLSKKARDETEIF